MSDEPASRILRASAVGIVLVGLVFVFFAVIGRHQLEARQVAATRNLQQWGIALNLCLMENGNQLPEVGREPVTPEQTDAWFNLLPPYLSEKPLANLPPGQRPRPGEPSLWIRPGSKPVKAWDPGVFYFQYGMNRFLQPSEGARSFRISEIEAPGGVIFMAPTDDFSPASEPETVVFPVGGDPVADILFCDGHVAPVPRARLLDPATLSATFPDGGVSWFRQ